MTDREKHGGIRANPRHVNLGSADSTSMDGTSSAPDTYIHALETHALEIDVADDLAQGLAALSQLMTGAGQPGLEQVLSQVAQFAVKALHGADGASVAVFEADRENTVVFTAAFVHEIDALQMRLGEGPCVTAAAERRAVHSGLLARETRWPRFQLEVGELNVASALSLPLVVREELLGSISVYSHARDAFHQSSVVLGEHFAAAAAVTVRNARALAHAQRIAGQLNSALSTRTVINQAVGVVMSRRGCTADDAFESLRRLSQTQNRKLSLVAQQLVEEAVRRARVRHTSRRSE